MYDFIRKILNNKWTVEIDFPVITLSMSNFSIIHSFKISVNLNYFKINILSDISQTAE